MAKGYVLGKRAANWLVEQMGDTGLDGAASGHCAETTPKIPHPWKVRYAASVGQDGAWIIWIPKGSMVGAEVCTDETKSDVYMRPLTPADDNMPTGWYELPADIQTALEDPGSYTLAVRNKGGYVQVKRSSEWMVIARVTIGSQTSGSGSVTVRTVNQIVRSAIVDPPPWSFNSTDYWVNCRLQIGYTTFLTSPDVSGGTGSVSGTDRHTDGDYYLEVDAVAKTAEIKVGSFTPGIDHSTNLVRIGLGTVTDGVLSGGLCMNPVIYTYQ